MHRTRTRHLIVVIHVAALGGDRCHAPPGRVLPCRRGTARRDRRARHARPAAAPRLRGCVHRRARDDRRGGFPDLGVSAETLRTVLVVATLVWIPVLFLVAERVARPSAGASAPWAAALAVLTAVCWSVPNHPRGMPTWYTLFLATAGTAAILRYLDTRRRRWLVVAGLAAGVVHDQDRGSLLHRGGAVVRRLR